MLSRTASNLYWMSRFVERAENAARILDVAYRMSLLTKDPALQDQEWIAPLNITGTLFPFSGRYDKVDARQVLNFMVLDPENPTSIYNCFRNARETARAVRGSITTEMWEAINSTWLEMKNMDEDRMHARGISSFFDWAKDRSHLFRGVTYGTMKHDEGYHFLRLGTYVERADNTARIVDVKYHVLLPSVKDVGGAVDYYQWSAVLRSLSSFAAFRKVYRNVISPVRVAELLVLRDDIPRSLHFCMRNVYQTLTLLSNTSSGEATRLAGEVYSSLQFGRISTIFNDGLHEYLTEFLKSTGLISEQIESSFFSPTLAE